MNKPQAITLNTPCNDYCGREPLEGSEVLGTADKNSGTGGCQPTVIGDVLQGGGTGNIFIRVRDVGADPPHGTGPGKLLAQGCQAD